MAHGLAEFGVSRKLTMKVMVAGAKPGPTGLRGVRISVDRMVT